MVVIVFRVRVQTGIENRRETGFLMLKSFVRAEREEGREGVDVLSHDT